MDRSPSGVQERTVRRLLPGDNPQAYLPGDRRRALAEGRELPLHATGSTMFVDISGFTPLTEALAAEHGARRGAEELTGTLERVFAALLERLHGWGGSVVYFSGDAVTAWLDADDGARAVAAALEMQRVMDDVGLVTTPAGREVRLGVKVAIAVGAVHRFVVGDPDVQLIDVLAGALMDDVAAAEGLAEPGDVVLDHSAVVSLGDRVALSEVRPGASGPVGVVAALVVPPPDPGPAPPDPVLSDDLVRPWLLPPVWDRMASGRGELLAELRPAVPVFLRFGGLDFEDDATAPARLDAFVRHAQRVLAGHGGSVLQLTIGDKGAYLYAVLGSPVAHEDDAVRACSAALALLERPDRLTVSDVQVGIATGRLRSGTYGHRERRTFCCLGDAVNLSARLMSKAPAGSVYVHEDVARATGERFRWQELEPLALKGMARPARVRALEGRAARVPAARRSGENGVSLGPVVGREEELAQLRSAWAQAVAGRGQVVVVQGEAGTGKSRLAAELVAELVRDGVEVATGEASAVAGSSYLGWRDVWTHLLGLDPAGATAEDVTAAVADLDARLAGRAPLLGAVLGVVVPDTELTGSFDAELRKTSLEDLLSRLLRARAARGPLVLHLEDAQWLDPLARDLLTASARATRSLPVLLLVTARPDGTPYAGMPLAGARATDLVLEALPEEAARALVVNRHRSVTGRAPAPATVDLVVDRAEGNAFYLEQLVDYLLAQPATGPDGALADLPASLHSLVLSRIDAQAEGPRQSLKVASVLGRSFASRLVADTYPDLGEEDDVAGHLLTAATTRLLTAEDRAARTFAFGHSVTRDVAYESLPYAVRTVLHGRAGDALEATCTGPEGAARSVDLLVHHYGLSDDIAKQRRWFVIGAEAARRTYDLDRAVGLLERALPLVDPDERPQVLLTLAETLETRGEWAEAEDAVARAREAADDVHDVGAAARARVAQAELDRKQGRYAAAAVALDEAEVAFAADDDRAGRARVLHLRGTLASQQGDPVAARTAYQASLELRRADGDAEGVAAMLTNLALVAEDEGDLDLAEQLGLDALQRRRELGDRRAESVSLMNLGMLALAREDPVLAHDRFEEAHAFAVEVGDPWLAAVGHHNLANTARDLGRAHEVADHLAAALEGYDRRDDLWSLAHLYEDVGLWLLRGADGHETEGAALLGAARTLREQIGAPRFTPTGSLLDAALAEAALRVEGTDLEAAERDGRLLERADVVPRVRSLLATSVGGLGQMRRKGAFGH